MKNTLISVAIVFVAASIGALAIWVLMNWMPNTTILVGAALAGYIAYTKVKK